MNTAKLTNFQATTQELPKSSSARFVNASENNAVAKPKAPPFKRQLRAPTEKTFLAASLRKDAYAELPPELV